MRKEYVANKALAEELQKRYRLIEKAYEQIIFNNYGIARKLLNRVLHDDPISINVLESKESRH